MLTVFVSPLIVNTSCMAPNIGLRCKVTPCRMKRLIAYKVAPCQMKRLIAYKVAPCRMKRLIAYKVAPCRMKRLIAYKVAPCQMKRLIAYKVAPCRLDRTLQSLYTNLYPLPTMKHSIMLHTPPQSPISCFCIKNIPVIIICSYNDGAVNEFVMKTLTLDLYSSHSGPSLLPHSECWSSGRLCCAVLH